MPRSPTLASLAADLAGGRTTARELVEQCLARIADPAGEGARVFISVDREGALAAAEAMDRLRKAAAAPSPFAGIPVSIKDLFDIRGQVTRAGSKVLSGRAALEDAPAVARLRRAGFVVIGRTNMTEFAYSGIGINPHYGTPKSAWRRDIGHVPGGSSSGAAVSVADGMAHGALGTDTGGSCRIPAAFNGIVGYKPTASRVPTAGAVPLSSTLDSVGPLGRSVACCAAIDAVLAGGERFDLAGCAVKGLRLAIPTNVVLDGLDDAVAAAFERAVAQLAAAGAAVERIAVGLFFTVVNGIRMALGHLGLGVGLGFAGPLAQKLLSQLAHLRAHARFGFIGGAVVGDGLVERIGQFVQPCQHVGPMRQPLFQGSAGRGNVFGFRSFIVHEPLQIYKIVPRRQG